MARIAIFQFDWPLQSHTINLASTLLAEGYKVDLVVSGCREDLVNLDRLYVRRGFSLVKCEVKVGSENSLLRRLFSFNRRKYREFVQRLTPKAVLAPYYLCARWILRRYRYDAFIGVEKMGLIWAGMLANKHDVPIFYFSLELYDEAHPYFSGRPGFSALRCAEKVFHARAIATIVQDESRGNYLLRSNGLESGNLIYLPVSVPGPPILEKGDYFRRLFNIPRSIPIVLYLGLMDESRGCLNVARLAKTYKDQFALVFHGYGDPALVQKLRTAGEGALYISSEMVPEKRLPEIVASADIGLALYRLDCANDRMTAFSSEKVALYCRAGLPFIAFSDVTYQKLYEEYSCCELLNSLVEFPEAVVRILEQYNDLSKQAYAAFRAKFCYEDNISPVVSRINQLLRLHG